jgi:hypothetical protein
MTILQRCCVLLGAVAAATAPNGLGAEIDRRRRRPKNSRIVRPAKFSQALSTGTNYRR